MKIVKWDGIRYGTKGGIVWKDGKKLFTSIYERKIEWKGIGNIESIKYLKEMKLENFKKIEAMKMWNEIGKYKIG